MRSHGSDVIPRKILTGMGFGQSTKQKQDRNWGMGCNFMSVAVSGPAVAIPVHYDNYVELTC